MEFNIHSKYHFIKFASILSNLTILDGFLNKLKTDYSITEKTSYFINNSLTEAVTNAIKHGNKENERKNTFISLEIVNTDYWIFKVRDEGPGFDHAALPDPTAPQNIGKLHGRGVFIMKNLSNQLIFNAIGNEVELHFKIQ